MTSSAPGEALDAAAAAVGVELAPAARDALLAYAALVIRWQRVANLTGAHTAAAFVREHVVDCLAVVPYLGVEPLLDVGSGAGLPGVVIALARPELDVTLLEPRGKRARFLRQAAIELALPRVGVVQARVEAHRPATGYGQITSRAVGSLVDFVATTAHLLAGAPARRLAMKATVDADDLAAAKGYLDEILLSLQPQLKRTQHSINISGDEWLTLDSYPGAFSQIITNLVMNSLAHAYEPGQWGSLAVMVKQESDRFISSTAMMAKASLKQTLKKSSSLSLRPNEARVVAVLGCTSSTIWSPKN